MENWTNHKYKAKIYVKEYVDLETGEMIPEEEYKQNYEKSKSIKNEYRTEYTRHARVTTRTEHGRRKQQQGKLEL